MKLDLALVADCANITHEGKLNVMGIFQQINSFNFPARHSLMHLVLVLQPELGESGERDLTIVLLNPNGKQIFGLTRKFITPEVSPGPRSKINIIVDLHNVTFLEPGPHNFAILIDKDHKGEIPIYVNKIEHPATE